MDEVLKIYWLISSTKIEGSWRCNILMPFPKDEFGDGKRFLGNSSDAGIHNQITKMKKYTNVLLVVHRNKRDAKVVAASVAANYYQDDPLYHGDKNTP